MPSLQRGFSLVELMVTVVVLGLLAALAVPSMSAYMENTRIHATAEVFYASVQSARTEAIRRNTPVELIFTNKAPTAASVSTTSLTSGGPNWIVRALASKASDAPTFVEGKSGTEAADIVAMSGPTSIRFDASGALAAASADAAVDFTGKRSTCETLGGSARCLRVIVSSGGQARLCDPAATAANDTRKC